MSNLSVKAVKGYDLVRMMLAVCACRDDNYWLTSEPAQPPGSDPVHPAGLSVLRASPTRHSYLTEISMVQLWQIGNRQHNERDPSPAQSTWVLFPTLPPADSAFALTIIPQASGSLSAK